MTFLVMVLKSYTVSILLNSAAKIFTISLGCHPLNGVTLGGQPLPLLPQ